MKIIFEKVKALLATVPEILWSDLDKGQIDKYNSRPSIPFPSALIKIAITNTEDIGGGLQRCACLVVIRLVFDYCGDTNNHVPNDAANDSLAYFDTTESVYKAIHYKGDEEIAPFKRRGQQQENRNDGLTVMNITFSTTFMDKTAI